MAGLGFFEGLAHAEREFGAQFLIGEVYLFALSVEQALTKLRKGGSRVAVVLGDDQREVGMVSVSDIVGAVVGEVRL